MLRILRYMRVVWAASAAAALLAGCATTQMNSQWKDDRLIEGLAKAGRVLVLCQARDDTLRRVCEDQWASELGAHGVVAVRSYSLAGFPPDGLADPAEVKAAAQSSGATAVARMQIAAGELVLIDPGPQLGFGVGSGSGAYPGGGFGFGAFGLSFPVGVATARQGLSSSTTLVDLASGALVWSGNASTAADDDATAQVSALTKITVEALKKAGAI